MALPRTAWLAFAAWLIAVNASAQVVWSGRVVDQNDAPVPRARITVHRDSSPPIEAESAPSGSFSLPVDAHRYPADFDLNLHIERRFTFHGYRLAVRVGCNNVTDHRNPTAVNAVVGAPAYLQFYGDEGRHFVVRIRMFGRFKP